MHREGMIAWLRTHLKAPRFLHTLGVEETARKLALRHGLDAESAALAGLLHDAARGLDIAEMEACALRAGAAINDYNRGNKALLHAPASVTVAREIFHVEDEAVLAAIRWHTTGRNPMTDLSKAIYLADMFEPNRMDFEGLAEVREAANRSLDEGMRAALAITFDFLVAQGRPIHPDTLDAMGMYPQFDKVVREWKEKTGG